MQRILLLLILSIASLTGWAQAPTSIYLRNTLIFSDNDRTPVKLVPILTPSTADNSVVWSSSDERVATVADGVVTPVSAGSAEIKVASLLNSAIAGICHVQVIDGDNLACDWDGNEAIGEGSEMSHFGWSCMLNSDTTAASGFTFQPTTGTAATGMRYDPQRKMTNSAGEAIYVRTAILRVKAATTTQYAVNLKANQRYRFNVKTAYGSNGQTYTVEINERKSALGTSLGKSSISLNGTSIKSNVFYPQQILFKPLHDGVHYICFKAGGASSMNAFITDMTLEPLQARVTVKYVDENGAELKSPTTILNLAAGNPYACEESMTANLVVDGKTYYYDMVNSISSIDELTEGENVITLKFSDTMVLPSASVKIYFKDGADIELQEPVVIAGLTPGERFTVDEGYKEAITLAGNVYLFDAAHSTLCIDKLLLGNTNSVTLKFNLTTVHMKSSLYFFKNKMTPQTLVPNFTPSNETSVYWECDDPHVAVVENGVVTPLGKGIAKIKAVSTLSDDLVASCVVYVKDQDNLLAGWDGSDLPGAGSEMNHFGWTCTLDADPENGETGLTFDPVTGSTATAHRYDYDRKMKDDLGNDFYGRTAIIRMKNTTTMNYPISLEAGKSYRFSAKVMYNSSGAKNNIGIYTEPSRKGSVLKSTTLSTESGNVNKLNPVNLTFTATQTGTHYLGFSTENSGVLTAFLVDLYIEEISSSVRVSFVDQNWQPIKDDIVITGLTPGKSYTISGNLKDRFIQDDLLYTYNDESFASIEKLIEGENLIILQFNSTLATSLSACAVSQKIERVIYYSLDGAVMDAAMVESANKGIFIKHTILEGGKYLIEKVIK